MIHEISNESIPKERGLEHEGQKFFINFLHQTAFVYALDSTSECMWAGIN